MMPAPTVSSLLLTNPSHLGSPLLVRILGAVPLAHTAQNPYMNIAVLNEL